MEDQTSTSHEEGSQRRCGGKPPASSDYASVKVKKNKYTNTTIDFSKHFLIIVLFSIILLFYLYA